MDNTFYVKAPDEFVGAIPVKQDITVLPADDPKSIRLGWTIYESIGPTFVNDSIYVVKRVTDSMFEIEDYIDEEHWPEWKIISRFDGGEIIIKAPNETIARDIFNEQRR